MAALYNEVDPAAAHILQRQIDDGVIAPGIVDTRSIKELTPDDLAGYTQVHLFAGGGLWSVAARLAGWPDDAPLWTGSCPCQPFSAAGKGLGTDDPRHLWPDFHRLIRACRPAVVMGEQVAGAAGYGWFDGVRTDLEGEGYAARAVDFPACSVDAPHQRNRLYWIAVDGRLADHDCAGSSAYGRDAGEVGRVSAAQCRAENDATVSRRSYDPAVRYLSGAGETVDLVDGSRRQEPRGSYWSDAEWIICHDGKARRTQPGIRDVAHGLSGRMDQDGRAGDAGLQEVPRGFLVQGLTGRVDLWRVAGNAIVPQAAAEVIGAFMETYGVPHQG